MHFGTSIGKLIAQRSNADSAHTFECFERNFIINGHPHIQLRSGDLLFSNPNAVPDLRFRSKYHFLSCPNLNPNPAMTEFILISEARQLLCRFTPEFFSGREYSEVKRYIIAAMVFGSIPIKLLSRFHF